MHHAVFDLWETGFYGVVDSFSNTVSINEALGTFS
jgi:hypothetical protein